MFALKDSDGLKMAEDKAIDDFFSAVCRGDVDQVRQMLKRNIHLLNRTHSGRCGRTALHEALIAGDDVMATLLLSYDEVSVSECDANLIPLTTQAAKCNDQVRQKLSQRLTLRRIV
ncbi:MAG: hypothetical protein NXH95_14450 [Pseudomonadaceae bacterium]|nr:hypothetical protein [Pseudomonadaceae bacterium]